MDIYFCDLCGARVTSVDLRSGVGMCRDEDVICGRCVELGRGPEWLARHQGVAVAPAVVAAVAAAASVPASVPVASPIDTARDRARTIDRDLVSEPVKPLVLPNGVPVVREDTDPEADPTVELPPGSVAVPAPIDAASDGLEITTKIESSSPDFSGLATSFSALGSGNETEAQPSADDLPDQQDLPDPATGNIHKESEVESDPKAAPDAVAAAGPENPVDPQAVPAPVPVLSGARNPRPRSSSSANPRVSGASNRSTGSGVAKPATGKTSRKNLGPGASARTARPAGFLQSKAAFKGLLIFSVIAPLAMAVLLYLAWCTPKKQRVSSSEPQTINLSEDVKIRILEVNEQVKAALRKNPPVEAELEKAQEAIFSLYPKIEEFRREAMGKAKYTEEQVGQVMGTCKWNDVNALGRDIRDKLQIIRNNRTMK